MAGTNLRCPPASLGRNPHRPTAAVAAHLASQSACCPRPLQSLCCNVKMWTQYDSESSYCLLTAEVMCQSRKPAPCWFGFDNHYGPAEATILATVYAIDASLEVPPPPPIGKPIPNTTLEIVDGATLEPMPRGEWGEILLGGQGIALGYLNLPEKTRERFLLRGSEGRRVYRTGDMGAYACRTVRSSLVGV